MYSGSVAGSGATEGIDGLSTFIGEGALGEEVGFGVGFDPLATGGGVVGGCGGGTPSAETVGQQ